MRQSFEGKLIPFLVSNTFAGGGQITSLTKKKRSLLLRTLAPAIETPSTFFFFSFLRRENNPLESSLYLDLRVD